jgi:hypothetical protein
VRELRECPIIQIISIKWRRCFSPPQPIIPGTGSIPGFPSRRWDGLKPVPT